MIVQRVALPKPINVSRVMFRLSSGRNISIAPNCIMTIPNTLESQQPIIVPGRNQWGFSQLTPQPTARAMGRLKNRSFHHERGDNIYPMLTSAPPRSFLNRVTAANCQLIDFRCTSQCNPRLRGLHKKKTQVGAVDRWMSDGVMGCLFKRKLRSS